MYLILRLWMVRCILRWWRMSRWRCTILLTSQKNRDLLWAMRPSVWFQVWWCMPPFGFVNTTASVISWSKSIPTGTTRESSKPLVSSWLVSLGLIIQNLPDLHNFMKEFNIPACFLPGETIKIVIEDYVQHLSGYHFKLKFDPELLFNERFQYQNRISSEFNTLYHWHPLMPDNFQIQDQVYGYPQFVFNNSILTQHGIHGMVDSFTKQTAGRVSFSIDRKLLREASCRSKWLSFFCGT